MRLAEKENKAKCIKSNLGKFEKRENIWKTQDSDVG